MSTPYPIVPDTGEAGRIRWGAREINLTRTWLAEVRDSIPTVWSIARGGTNANNIISARTNLGIRSGTANPTGGADGDIYFKIV